MWKGEKTAKVWVNTTQAPSKRAAAHTVSQSPPLQTWRVASSSAFQEIKSTATKRFLSNLLLPFHTGGFKFSSAYGPEMTLPLPIEVSDATVSRSWCEAAYRRSAWFWSNLPPFRSLHSEVLCHTAASPAGLSEPPSMQEWPACCEHALWAVACYHVNIKHVHIMLR